MSAGRRKTNAIAGQFIAHRMAMLESAAWRTLSFTARRILDRIEIEHGRHGGVENGKLPVTYDDFAEFGIRRKAISSGLFELVALGFIEITQRGRMAAAQFHVSSKYRLTYIFTRQDGQPTDEWSKFTSDVEALAAVKAQARKMREKVARKKEVIGKTVAGGRATALPVGAPPRRSEDVDDWTPLASLAVKVLSPRDIDRGGGNATETVGAETPPELPSYRGGNAPRSRGGNAPDKMISGRRQHSSREVDFANGGSR
jgi:hypothetical protein